MIQSLLTPLNAAIAARAYVDTYGGLIRVASRTVQAKENSYTEVKYPVSTTITDRECWQQGRYLNLAPDGRKRSVFYLEDMDGLTTNGIAKKGVTGSHLQFTDRIRLVGWLNMPALGHAGNEMSGLVGMDLLGIVQMKNVKITEPFKATVSYVVEKFEPKTVNPFEKYSYSDIDALLFYPYDWVSMVIRVNAVISRKCFEGVALGEPACK